MQNTLDIYLAFNYISINEIKKLRIIYIANTKTHVSSLFATSSGDELCIIFLMSNLDYLYYNKSNIM